MPPKKKDEDIDPATLPPWLPVSVRLNYECSKDNAVRISEIINSANFEIKKVITRNDIINYGKEKGLYIDPTQMTEKQKKDKNFAEIPTELTPELLAKIFIAFFNEINLNGRKTKKEKLDAIAAGKDLVPAKKETKDVKKDAKKPKQDIKEEEKKEEPPLDTTMQKACDIVYLLQDYPTTENEVSELSKAGGGIDLFFRVKEKVIFHKSFEESDLLDRKENFEEDLKTRLDDFVDTQEEKKKRALEEKAKKESENQEFIKQSEEVLSVFKKVRQRSQKKEYIRNMTIKEIVCTFDSEVEVEEINTTIKRQIYEEICNFSLEIVGFQEWIKDKKAHPLLDIKEVRIEEPDNLQRASTPQEKDGARPPSRKEDIKKDIKEEKKKDSKQIKKPQEETKKEEMPVEEAKPTIQIKQDDKASEVELMNTYEKQLRTVEEENMTIGALLEALVDEVSHQTAAPSDKLHKNLSEIERLFDDFQKNIIDDMSHIRSNVKNVVLNEVDITNPYQYVMDESDDISKKTLNSQFSNQEYVRLREHQIFDRITLPGVERNLMPERSLKSENLRKAEKSQLHPFISFEITDCERFQLIELFETIMKEQEKEREWNFGDRIFEERLNPNVLKQRLYHSLLYGPDLQARYYDQEDALLLALYFRNPPGRILRKKWTCNWRVLPNLENWINYFKNNDKNLYNEFFYDIDYHLVENLHERIKLMFPNDQSVIMCSQFKVGDHPYNHYRILKENLVFGIRKSLYQQNPHGEIWALFENGTKLLVEIEKEGREVVGTTLTPQSTHPEELTRVDDPSSLNQKDISHDPSKDVLESKGEHLGSKNTLTIDHGVNNKIGASFSLSLQNGLIVKFLPNGDILQTMIHSGKAKKGKAFDEVITDNYQKEDASEIEKNRLITGKGSVIRYMKDGSIQILYANGNFSLYKKNTEVWITTNNKGLRKGRRLRDGSEFELEAIPSARKTDPETGCKILIREDKVMVINYPDGHTYTEHKDGTKFYTSPDGNTIWVEHRDFATVKVIYDPVKARMGTIIGMGSSSAYQGFENIMERSFNGRVTETYLPDGSKVVGYQEKRELEGYENYETCNVHLLYQPEGSVLKFKDNGEVVIISANDRFELNAQGENRAENDIDYFLQLFGVPEERKNGVYTTDLVKGTIWTKDDEGNFFSISASGETKGKIAVSFDLNQNGGDEERPGTPDVPDGDFVEEQNQFLPPPRKILSPRLFIIRNDSTGSEFFNESQLSHYFRVKDQDPECSKIVDSNVPGIPNCESITFLTRFLVLHEKKRQYINVKIPKNVDIIPQTETIQIQPAQFRFTYRNFLKYLELNEEKREVLHRDLEKFAVWKKAQAKEAHEFGIKDRTEEDKQKEYSVQQKILESRRTHYHTETYDECWIKIGSKYIPPLYYKYLESLERETMAEERAKSPAKKDQNKDAIPKSWLDALKRKIERKEEIYPLGIDFTQVDLKDTSFVGNYFLTYPGHVFQKGQPDIDIKDILENKAKLRKTRELIKLDPALAEEDEQRLQPQAVVQIERAISLPTKKQGEESKMPSQQVSPSWNMVRDLERKKQEIEDERKAQEYHSHKTMKYDVYGDERTNQELVQSVIRPIPEKILNTKYIITESTTDRRVRISSMARRPHLYAPSIDDIRTQGTHELMRLTMDKKNDKEGLLEKKDLMTTASVTDPLKRDLLIFPVNLNFGKLRCGVEYEQVVRVKNEDPLPQRLNIRQPKKPFIFVKQSELGTIALGMTREIIVTIKAREEDLGSFFDYFEIVSKHDIYRIPITGEIKDIAATDTDKPNAKSRLKPISSKNPKSNLSDSHISDDMPTLKYEKNTKLDINLKRKQNEESYYSGDGDN